MEISFEDVPLAEARALRRGPRMDPVLYQALTQKIAALSTSAARLSWPPEIAFGTMKRRLLRVAQELDVPVTIRRVAGGLVLWRSTPEDLEDARALAARLQEARHPRRQARPGRHRQG